MVTAIQDARTRPLLIMALAAALLAATLLALLGLRPLEAAAPAAVPFQVLRNGGFELGDQPWETPNSYIDNADNAMPLAGVAAAHVWGEDPGGNPGLRQVVTIPPSTAATLSFYAMYYACECGGSGQFIVRYTDGNGVTQAATFSVGQSTGYEHKTLALGSYPTERAVTIEFATGHDYLTYIVDEVSLVADAIDQPSLRAVPSAIYARSEYLQTEPITRTLRIEWIGGYSADWTLSADQPWIGLPTLSGSDTMTVSVVISPATLGPGDHTGNIYISNPELPTTIVPVHLAARGSTDVGVLRGEDHTCGAHEEVVMILDEDGDGGSVTGWQAGIGKPNHMNFVFCRVDGTKFKPFGATANPNNRALNYAVLQLGHHCPDGSYQFRRDIDTEDGHKNYDSSSGNIWPNYSSGNATFYFCYFPGRVFTGAVPATHMSAFPAQRFSYGVFATDTHLAALDSGSAYVVSESDDNRDSYSYAPDFPIDEQAHMIPIIEANLIAATVFNYIKVFDAPTVGSTACNAPPHLFCTTTRVVSAFPLKIEQEVVRPQFCPASPRPIDLSISLYRNPNATERAHYEAIIRSMADAVFESSNGVHQLRDIIFYVNSRATRSANILWNAGGHPKAYTSAYFLYGDYRRWLMMYDRFVSDNTKALVRDYMDRTPANSNDRFAGYTLGHEMGHFFYGLGDEYSQEAGDKVPPGPSIMNAEENAVFLNNNDWLNFSSVNPGPNDQTRTYGASGWDTLLRNPNDDPRHAKVLEEVCDESYLGLCADYDVVVVGNGRACMPELGWVDPGNGTLVELQAPPPAQSAARAILNVIWWGATAPPPTSIPLVDDQDVDTWPLIHELEVDEDVDHLDVTIDRPDPDDPPVTVIVRDPNDNEVKRVLCPDPANPRQKQCKIRVPQPRPPGGWTVIVDNPNDADIDVKVEQIVTPDGEAPIVAEVHSAGGPAIAYPRPLVLEASVMRELPMTGVGIVAYAETPAGVRTPLPFVDDGTGPDRTAGDGLYTAELPYGENGDYFVHVAFDNAAGTALYTSALYEDGGVSDPVGVPFQRVATTFVTVSNVQPDDHPDQCSDATLLTVNGAAYPGRIDRGGDVDLFAVQSTSGGQVIVRIDSLYGGMLPHLRIRDAAGGALIKSVQVDPSDGAYLTTLVDLPANRRLCLEVRPQDFVNGTGSYRIEIGDELESEAGRELLLSVRGTADGATVTDALDWEVLARVGEGAAAGAGIQWVNVVVRGPDGEVVFQRELGAPAYCVLGEPPCAPWRFADHGLRWPNGAAVQDGVHLLAATAIAADGRAERVDRAVTLDLTAPPPPPPMVYTISGRITLDGAGLAGVSVTAGGRRATTNAQGEYTLRGLAAGTYTVTPRLAGYTFSPPSRQVTISNAPVPAITFTGARTPAPPDPNEAFKAWLPFVQQ